MRKAAFTVLVLIFAGGAAPAAPTKVGEEIVRRFETPHPYPAAPAGAAESISTTTVTHPGAAYVAPHFSYFSLAKGDYLIVRSEDGSRSWRYEGLGKDDRGESPEGFWGIHIAGDTAILELHTLAGGGGDGGYVVDRYARGFTQKEIDKDGAGISAVCGTDDSVEASCLQGAEPAIYEKSRAVARILVQGSILCTGWLVGNAGHVMTNNHCIPSAAEAADTDFEMMAEGASCATDCRTTLGCPGTIVATSSTLVQTNVNLDYALLRLPVNPTGTYGFLKLRSTVPALGERIYVPNHPQGWGKRIASDSSDPGNPSGFCEIDGISEPACIGGTAPEIGYQCDTAEGSSGAPVIAYADHKVVALHHCANCPNRGVRIPDIIASLGSNVPPGAVFDPVGAITLDRAAYGCASAIGIEVRDDNLTGAGTASVSLQSTTESAPQTVTLAENPAGSGRFTGSSPTTSGSPSGGDGMLSVAHGDTLTATYLDADDGMGGHNVTRNDTAAVDCVAPAISGTRVQGITGSEATIAWETDEPADGRAMYGPSAPPGLATATDPNLAATHATTITGLQSCTTYSYGVVSKDAAGNSSTDDAGGAWRQLTTLRSVGRSLESMDTPVAILDNAVVSATIQALDAKAVTDVNVRVNVSHTYDGDLRLRLIGPDNTTVILVNRRGASGDGFSDTVFDDEALAPVTAGAAPFTGMFRPEEPLAAFDGKIATGIWRLSVSDLATSDIGAIESVEIDFSFAAEPCVPHATSVSYSTAEACPAGGAGNGNGVVEPGETVSMSITIVNDGTVDLTGVTATLSTTTPGVTIIDGSAAYPPLAKGASTAGLTPFSFTVAPAAACSSDILFQIHVTAGEGGPWSDPFARHVGRSGGTLSTTYASTNVPRPIPDAGSTTSTLSIPVSGVILDLDAEVSIQHTYAADVGINLRAPGGATVTLTDGNGGGGADYTGTIFDDEATVPISSGTAPFTGRFRPEQALNRFDGSSPAGTWTLGLFDASFGDTGQLDSWSLTISTSSPPICNVCNVVSAPGEVPMLWWDTEDTLAWDPAPGAATYDLYRGSQTDLPKIADPQGDSCGRGTTAHLSMGDLTEVPATGEFYWWIVRARNAAGAGPAGGGTVGPWVHDSTGSCP